MLRSWSPVHLVSVWFGSLPTDRRAASSLSFDRLMTSDPSLKSSGPCGSDGAEREVIGPVFSLRHPDLCFQMSQAEAALDKNDARAGSQQRRCVSDDCRMKELPCVMACDGT